MVERRASGLLASIDSQQASINTKEHAVYAYFFLGFKIPRIATIYRKGQSTIFRWIERYKETGDVSRLSSKGSHAKFSQE
jgi:transposase